jgi:hypothetical protein
MSFRSQIGFTFINGFFTACRSFAAFCKLSDRTGGNCRQLPDKIILPIFFVFLDGFLFWYFQGVAFRCACRMHNEMK